MSLFGASFFSIGPAVVFIRYGYVDAVAVAWIAGAMAIGVACGLVLVEWRRCTVLTIRIDADSVSIARGRGEPRWATSRWAELLQVRTRTKKKSGGHATEWIELQYPNGRTYTIRQSDPGVCEYELLKQLIFDLHDRHKRPA